MTELSGKKIVILGLARQGKALAQFAAISGAHVTVSDLRTEEQLHQSIQELNGLEITYVLGEHPMNLLQGTDILAISGGISANAPLVQAARDQEIIITNDSHEFIQRSPATCIGITGSAGKTTTTALTGAMGEAAGRNTWIGGNIGRPLITEIEKIKSGDLVVQELSSFQLEIWQHSPPVAAVLNVTPNHLDRHQSMTAYSDAKANILRYQTTNDIAVLSADDPGAMAMASMVHGRLRLFSIKQPVSDGAYIKEGHIWLVNAPDKEQVVCPLNVIKLRGRHNLLNVCAAVTLADSVDIPTESMVEAIRSFHGVEHRLEWVATINGVQFVNDSIATAPERALAAIDSYDEPLILLAGGKDKNMIWDPWAQHVNQRVSHIILFGELAPFLAEKLEKHKQQGAVYAKYLIAKNLHEAVDLAADVAAAGDIVLLSPGGTSYDTYIDFAERGEHFRAIVKRRAQNFS
ncbi:MAG: UDP-N-acetylmuramoyl-L-alanine--D-glutamate ligase [Candidatus Promineifilaceae bacterium]|nr:UDP-N-acetylmuramoyl-L-alanine--D-glutamate ligase [Candidatus Promineifilaceae bacterium]